jgi:hypothetical protein
MAGQTQASPQQQNAINRQILLGNSQNMWLPIFTQTFTGGPGTIINIPLRNVGLVKRLVVEIAATTTQGAAETQTRTKFGPANFFSNILLTDLSNQTRINTTGWHLHCIATAKRQWAFGSAYTNDSPVGIGSNYPVMNAPASFTTVQSWKHFVEIPVSYGDLDLRGAIYANVVNATFNLQLTVNPNFFIAAGADPALGVYQSSTAQAGVLNTFTITLHQNFLDQLPVAGGKVILPALDLGTAYLLNNTTVTGIVANQDNPLPYANFRDFMSTTCIYDNFGYVTAPIGSDLTYWTLQSANYTNILKYDPFMSSLLTREIISDDFPAVNGMTTYYFDHRAKPISTISYGNMQLIFNPANAQGAATQMLVGFEALAYINQVTQAGSLYGT